MKKVVTLVTLVVVLIGGYFLYSFLMRKSTAELWTLIPDDTFAVVEIRESDEEWEEYEESKLRTFLSELPYYNKVKQKVNYVSEALSNGTEYGLLDILGEKTFLLSFHQTGDLGVEALLYLPLVKEDKHFLKQISKVFKSNNSFLLKKQKYKKRKYNELHFLETNEILYFQEFHGVFIASFSKELFIKTLKGKLDIKNLQKSRIAKLKKQHEESEIETKNVNVFIDYSAFSNVLSKYLNEDSGKILKEIADFSQFSFLGLELEDDVATFSGFTTCSDSTVSYLSLFDDQNPDKADWLEMIPLNTVTSNLFYVSDPLAYTEKVKAFSWDENQERGIYDEFLELISGDVLYLNLFSSAGEVDNVFVYNSKDVGTSFRWMKEQSTGQIEEYFDHKIGVLKNSDIVSQLHGDLYNGTEVNVFSIVDDFVVLSSSLPALKEYILNVTSKNTWANSDQEGEHFEDHFLESNFSFYVNPRLAQKAIYDNLSSEGAKLRDDASSSIVMFDFFLLEYSFQGEKYYTDLVLKFGNQTEIEVEKQQTEVPEKPSSIKELFKYSSSSNIISKPFVVKNYLHRTREVLIQNEDKKLSMIDHEGKLRWSYKLDEEIISEVFEVDVFKNQKIQYLFATSGKIYVLDRKGRVVENFPLVLPEGKPVESLNVFDYDENKNYRIIATSGSESYLFNVSGTNLDGWNPKVFDSKVVGSLSHIRVRSKDYIVAFTKDGTIDVVNRRGERIKGFPLNLGDDIIEKGIVKVGNSNSKTYFYTIVKGGKVFVSNLNGKVVSELNLVGKSNMRLIDNGGEVVAFSKGDNAIYINNMMTSEELVISEKYNDDLIFQFYNISGKRHYVITDLVNNKTAFYNGAGELINQEEISSTSQVAMLYSSSKNIYRVYVVSGSTFKLLEF